MLDLSAGSNASVPSLRDWVENGYPGVFEIPASGSAPTGGRPGLVNTLRTSVASRIGDTVLILVHNGVSGTGTNAVYNVVGLLAVKIVSVQGNGGNLKFIAVVVQCTSSGFITCASALNSTSMSKVVLVK